MKKLYRSRTDVKVSGVCAGIGEYFNIDATLIRLLWVLVTLMSGFFVGLLAYFVCVLVIPVDDGYIHGDYQEKQ